MRVGLFLLGLPLCFPGIALAQPEAVQPHVVSQASALVRSLPNESPQSYATNQLKRGALVQVVKAEGDGWLRILPPSGSYSWINKRFVHQPTAKNPSWVVTAARDVKVPVLIGSDQIGNTRPQKVGASLQRGAIVVAVGQPLVDEEGAWLPIEPPPGEYRYIRVESVTRSDTPAVAGPSGPSPFNPARPEANGGNALVGNGGLQQPNLNIPNSPAGVTGQPRTQTGRVEQLWGQAVQAERAGNISEAILLYTQVGTEGAGTNHDLAMQALNRAFWLRQSGKNQTVQGLPTQPPSVVDPANGTGSRFIPTGNPKTEVPTGSTLPAPTTTAARPSSVGGHPWTTPPGVLRFSDQRILPGRKVYLLMTRDERPISYVTAGYGVDLEPYLNREVELIGQAVYRSDLKTNLMVVERVQIMR